MDVDALNMNSKPENDDSVGCAPLRSGQSLKHFRVEGVLGQGGMGFVYRAQDTSLHRPVAVKVLPSALTSDADRKQRFLREARAAARISHPTVAQIYFVDEQDGMIFIVMELVEGRTVRDLILAHDLDLLGAIEIGLQVSEGLSKAHELGIVHRDIKPANVMVTPEHHVKILDFGLAKLLEPTTDEGPTGTKRLDWTYVTQTESGMILGTAPYMSPEQVRGVAVDARSDLFSLGVLLFEMATGHSPFQRNSLMDTMHAVAFDDTPIMDSVRGHIPGELKRIVAKCLKKQPEDRYSSARLLAEDLRLLRRETEAGMAHATSLQQRLRNAWEQFRETPPSRYAWYGLGAMALGAALYLSLARVGTAGAIFLAGAVLWIYRYIRNLPHKQQETFVRKVAKIPEVRFIAFQERQATIIVERPVAQLYSRINHHLRSCNRKLYFGPPMTVSILHQVSGEQITRLLSSPGVQYVREDLTGTE